MIFTQQLLYNSEWFVTNISLLQILLNFELQYKKNFLVTDTANESASVCPMQTL